MSGIPKTPCTVDKVDPDPAYSEQECDAFSYEEIYQISQLQ
jgi:hypothetical protein